MIKQAAGELNEKYFVFNWIKRENIGEENIFIVKKKEKKERQGESNLYLCYRLEMVVVISLSRYSHFLFLQVSSGLWRCTRRQALSFSLFASSNLSHSYEAQPEGQFCSSMTLHPSVLHFFFILYSLRGGIRRQKNIDNIADWSRDVPSTLRLKTLPVFLIFA